MMGTIAGKALVIAGHGSLRNPNTRKPVCQAVGSIRRQGLFDEVVCGLWKERPHFKEVLEGLVSQQVIIVPMFMAEGYYTRVVIPREFGLRGPVSWVGGKSVRMTRALGTHPYLAELIVERAVKEDSETPETLIILGHGTPRNPDSAKTAEEQADRIRQMGRFPQVLTAFIDQDPHIHDVIPLVSSDRAVIVPFFVADGWHVTETITEDLGIDKGHVVFAGKHLRYTGAVGTNPDLWRVIIDLVDDRLNQG